jgi:hypothetical protein
MAMIAELFALSKAYPIISIVIALVLFFIGLKVAGKLIKLILWALAILAIAAAVYMILFY